MHAEGFDLRRSVVDLENGQVLLRFRVHNRRPSPADIFVFMPGELTPNWTFVPEHSVRRVEAVVSRRDLHLLEAQLRDGSNVWSIAWPS